MDLSGCPGDSSFGPVILGCRGSFDFTLQFEKIFFSIIPSCIFIAASLARCIQLMRRSVVARGLVFRYIKMTILLIYTAIQLSLLVLSCTVVARPAYFFVPSTALSFSAALCMMILSWLEHSRSPRPTILLNGYLTITLLFDIAQSRSLELAATAAHDRIFAHLFTAGTIVRLLIIAVESQRKTRWLLWNVDEHSPEEMSGLYGIAAFLWLVKLFRTGNRKLLTLDDLFPLDWSIRSETLAKTLGDSLQAHPTRGKPLGLLAAVAKVLAIPLLLPVAPRLALSGLRFAQPFLINSVLSYLEQPSSESKKNAGYGLIGATIIIYVGNAISTGLYYYFQERALWMTRGALASVVYKKTTESKLSAAEDSAALTLMSTDIERIRFGFLPMHDLWAAILEVSVASWLLYNQLGVAFLATIIVVLVCMVCIMGVTAFAGKKQKAWMERIQKRVGMTSSAISNMKHLKISGLTVPMEGIIQQLRVEEINAGSGFRKILIMALTFSFAPSMLGPALTFAFAGRDLNVTTIFTSLSLLVLLTGPLSQVFQFVPSLQAGVTCFQRIQTFLEKDTRHDFRNKPLSVSEHSEKEIQSEGGGERGESPLNVMTVAGGSFGWQENKLSLKELDLDIPSSGVTIVIGPVASGKSTLCNVLLGETPVFNGRVTMMMTPASRRIGYCSQVPFLSNDTIRKNITGFSPFNLARYNEVVEATMLLPDFAALPRGDGTKIGSNGITLSGGQKQRISMARALYLQSELLVFDDIISGLDTDTEDHVFRRVFGRHGLVRRRKVAAVLCTHSVRHLPSADHIIVLGPDGSLVEQGNFEQLVTNGKYVHSLGVEAALRPEEPAMPTLQDGSPTSPTPWLSRTPSATSEESESSVDGNRQAGDSTVYKHYAKAIGWPILSSFILFAATTGFLFSFPQIWLSFWSGDIASSHRAHSNAYWVGLYALLQILCLASLVVCCIFGFFFLVAHSGSVLHKEVLGTVMAAPLRFFAKTDAGAVTNLFSQDMTLIDSELPQALLNITLEVFSIIGMAAILATSSPYVAIAYPFLLAILWLIQKYYLRTSRQLRLLDLEAKSPLYTHFTDTLNGLATFRAFGWVHDSIYLNSRLLDDSQRPAYLLSMAQRCLTFVLNMIVSLLATLVVVLATQSESTTGAGFTGASLVALMEFGANLAHAIQVYTLLETSIGAISRLKGFSEKVAPETLPGEDMVPPVSWPFGGAIEISKVSASYLAPDEQAMTKVDLVLKELELSIQPGEKVAICGRSGSGKSSTILLLLRLLDPLPSCAESITIDGIPLHRVDRSILRQRVIAVSQDAVFLPDGTSIGRNLDPFEGSTDEECRKVLETVGLWHFAEEQGGLSAGMSADSLSQGQKQLFSLARAILRRRIRSRQAAKAATPDHALLYEKDEDQKRVTAAFSRQTPADGTEAGGLLLLDEVSSSVDVYTDRMMQALIKTEFANYTIVMVSHRLDMVMDFDRVLVMDQGRVVESGSPHTLIEQQGGRFRELWVAGRHQVQVDSYPAIS